MLVKMGGMFVWYRKRPVSIEAFQYNGTVQNFEPWAKKALEDGVLVYTEAGVLQVVSGKDVLTVNVGDYVIKGVQGELYPCHEDIFMQTYESEGDM